MATKRYPVGIQTFSEIREGGYFYVDKTAYVYDITHTSGKYFFLSRPRRFGKSLLTSTFKSYFEGRKDLFSGLAIEKLEKEWTERPVLYFDMSLGKHMEEEALIRYLLYILGENEDKYGVHCDAPDPNIRLSHLIKTIYQKTGKKVVVLIDEYDAPLLDVVHEDARLKGLRNIMRNFYSPLKACDPFLEFAFITGITKFSQLSIFSELNNITNISMLPKYAGICGITKEELVGQMDEDVTDLSQALGMDKKHTLLALKRNYDGYHFCWPSTDVFNPYSLLNAFTNGNLDSYWFESGTPTYLIQMMQKFSVLPSAIGPKDAKKSAFDAPTQDLRSITPLLYQSGYTTIKGYDPITQLYKLDIPNQEIRTGLFECLLPYYVEGQSEEGDVTIARMSVLICKDDMDGALRLLQDFLSTVPYCNHTDHEGHYQQVFYIIFTLLTNYPVDVEVHTPRGRVDIVMMTRTRIFIMELKLNRDAATAMKQMNLKNYSERFSLSKLPVTKVAVNFDTDTRNIKDWKIE